MIVPTFSFIANYISLTIPSNRVGTHDWRSHTTEGSACSCMPWCSIALDFFRTFLSNICIIACFWAITGKMSIFSTIKAHNFGHIYLSFAFGVPFGTVLFLVLGLCFLTPILVTFLVGTISCFMSKLPTVSTTCFKCFLGPFLIGWTCEEGIVVLLFIPTLSMSHCLIFILQNLFNF